MVMNGECLVQKRACKSHYTNGTNSYHRKERTTGFGIRPPCLHAAIRMSFRIQPGALETTAEVPGNQQVFAAHILKFTVQSLGSGPRIGASDRGQIRTRNREMAATSIKTAARRRRNKGMIFPSQWMPITRRKKRISDCEDRTADIPRNGHQQVKDLSAAPCPLFPPAVLPPRRRQGPEGRPRFRQRS